MLLDITCEIVPEYENTFSVTAHDHTNSEFNLLAEEEDHL